ncbi:unnamed protein product [Rotaria socialis]|uniref:Uncharacterized protein n=1 Tax=Rotaria socialis TaxID=392032 RepID=A0A817SX17_9BILA|nr:unnamed protein product [Rotaria socialis]CAF3291792.1 unnamed protein product [Rotaria socialis]CAF3303537.1 unnamed protein product [Rotaria socialis]CAF3663997.1 unnamed protein product [Rotaria socialis]CAF4290439.1 unnamed protein product [Rotaria socialis]
MSRKYVSTTSNLITKKNVETGYFSTSKSRIVDYSHLNQHDPDFDSHSSDSSGEGDEDTTENCTDNEYSTENDEDYVSIIVFSKLVRLNFKECEFLIPLIPP